MLPIVIAELRAATARGATGMTRALVHASKRASRKRSIAPREIPAREVRHERAFSGRL